MTNLYSGPQSENRQGGGAGTPRVQPRKQGQVSGSRSHIASLNRHRDKLVQTSLEVH